MSIYYSSRRNKILALGSALGGDEERGQEEWERGAGDVVIPQLTNSNSCFKCAPLWPTWIFHLPVKEPPVTGIGRPGNYLKLSKNKVLVNNLQVDELQEEGEGRRHQRDIPERQGLGNLLLGIPGLVEPLLLDDTVDGGSSLVAAEDQIY